MDTRIASSDSEIEALRREVDELKRDKADLRSLVELLRNELARVKDDSARELEVLKGQEEARCQAVGAEYEVKRAELKKRVDELESVLKEKEEELKVPGAPKGPTLATNASVSSPQTRGQPARVNTIPSGVSFEECLERLGGLDTVDPPRKRKVGEGPETEEERAERYEILKDIYDMMATPPKKPKLARLR